jgi:hypothetical protein
MSASTKDVGRNDPCPCGSGAKYKYCCMNADAGGDFSASALFSASDASSGAASSSSASSPLDEVFERFDRADYEDRKALVEEIVGDPERMDEENAFHMFNELCPVAIERGEAEWLSRTITHLEREQPDVYAAERPYLLSYLLAAAVVTGDVETVAAERVDDLAKIGNQDIDEFHPIVDLIAYHGSLAPIAQAMSNGWPNVRENADIMPFGKNNFANQGIQYALLAYYEEHGTVDLDDSALQDRLAVYDETEEGEVDFEYLERFAERLSGPNTQSWQIEVDPAENIYWLAVDFMCSVHAENDIPLGRIDLARKTLSDCYDGRNDGGVLGTDPDFHLTSTDIERQFESIGTFASSRPHRRSAFFCLLPAWLSFLEARELISSKAVASMRRTLHGLKGKVRRMLATTSMDPSLPADVKAALG